MKRKLGLTFVPIVLVGFLQLQLAATASEREEGTRQTVGERQITVRIHDYAHANPSVLLHAEQTAGHILRQAGVEAIWIECPIDASKSGKAACPSPITPLDFVLNLVPRAMSDHLGSKGDMLGVAFESTGNGFGFYSSVFYDEVKDCARQHQQDWSRLLGHAIAHELGHLLLGPDSHSKAGLMCAFWSRSQLHAADQYGLTFSDAEAKRIQAAIAERTFAAPLIARALAGPRTTSSEELSLVSLQARREPGTR